MRRLFTIGLIFGGLAMLSPQGFAEPAHSSTTLAVSSGTRIASVFLSEDLINTLLKDNLKTKLLRNASINVDPEKDQIIMHGIFSVPTEDLQAINLEPGLGDFGFQLAIKLKVTKHGHLLLIFPLDQTFFYPANSKRPDRDRVIIPVQFLSLALASARGYLALLSGDFSGLDRKARALQAEIVSLDSRIASTQDLKERALLEGDRKKADNELTGIPIEREQAAARAKQLESVLGFVGENEINLNEELSARHNALILKIKMGQLAPYLADLELGGVRLIKDERDGSGEDFLGIDVNAQIPGYPVDDNPKHAHAKNHGPPQRPPDVVIRLNQALFETTAILDAEKDDLGTHIKNFSMQLKEDGIHATGTWWIPILPNIPFDAIVDLTSVSPNVFDIRVREIKVAHIDLKILTGLVLETARKRLDATLKGACTFQYIGEESDHSRAIRVTVNMAAFIPAFPKMSLTGIHTKEKELILKAGQL